MRILISQNKPGNAGAYTELEKQFGAEFDFRPFFCAQTVSPREWRAEHIDFKDYTAVILSSRLAIDAYFQLCQEMRFKVPETMKYFCTSELVAAYLQKHIVYRKRKVFFADGTPEGIAELIGPKHAGEKFLITTSDSSNAGPLKALLDAKGIDSTVAVLVSSVPRSLKDVKFEDYDIAVLYNAADVKSLFESFPDFKQGNLKILTYGKGVVKALTDAGLSVAFQAPTPQAPSVAKALELFLKSL